MNFMKTLNCISRVYYEEYQYNQMVTIPGCQFMQYIREPDKGKTFENGETAVVV